MDLIFKAELKFLIVFLATTTLKVRNLQPRNVTLIGKFDEIVIFKPDWLGIAHKGVTFAELN